MDFSDYKIFINGKPVVRSSNFPDTRSKNQKKKDRKEFYKNKRKQFKGIKITIPMEKPWHEKIIIKEDE